MTSMWPNAVASLDSALAVLGENVGKLEAAQAADLAEMLEQLKTAAASAHMVRELVSSQLPEVSWQSRAELDDIIAQQTQDPAMSGMYAAELGVVSASQQPA